MKKILKMKINKEWHLANRMPKNPTIQQRIDWHLLHQKYCNCRLIPEKLLKVILEKNL